MFPFKVASIYSHSLFRASSKELLENYLNQLEFVSKIVSKPEIWYFFCSPQIKNERKKELIEKNFKQNVDEKILDFIKLLIDRERFKYLNEILEYFRKLVFKELGKTDALLTTAVPANKEFIEALRERLEQLFTEKFIMRNKVDSKILGGSILLFDNQMFDASLRTKLKNLKDDLLLTNV